MIQPHKWTGIIDGKHQPLCKMAVSPVFAGAGYNGAPDGVKPTLNNVDIDNGYFDFTGNTGDKFIELSNVDIRKQFIIFFSFIPSANTIANTNEYLLNTSSGLLRVEIHQERPNVYIYDGLGHGKTGAAFGVNMVAGESTSYYVSCEPNWRVKTDGDHGGGNNWGMDDLQDFSVANLRIGQNFTGKIKFVYIFDEIVDKSIYAFGDYYENLFI